MIIEVKIVHNWTTEKPNGLQLYVYIDGSNSISCYDWTKKVENKKKIKKIIENQKFDSFE